ncbi:MAG: hypothetical protein HY506_02295 [Candidatus Yanofskybacteria bacterium]|nr:hypothetical protein [Candidatus Yanofskybacteria bacterium]
MRKVAFPVVLLGSLVLAACDNAPRLPQGTFVKEDNAEIQIQFDRLSKNETATVTIGNEHVTLTVLKDFMSIDNIRGVGGGNPCKAYMLTTKDGTTEVGVVCKDMPFGKKWEHHPWREWFDSLG